MQCRLLDESCARLGVTLAGMKVPSIRGELFYGINSVTESFRKQRKALNK